MLDNSTGALDRTSIADGDNLPDRTFAFFLERVCELDCIGVLIECFV